MDCEAILVKELKAGKTLAQASFAAGISPTKACHLVRDLPIPRLRRSRIQEAERGKIERTLRTTDLSLRKIGSRFGRAPSTIHRILKSLRHVEGRRALRQPVRCPTCGALVVSLPCLACEITGRAKRATESN
jgi:hypothetical protein